MCECTRENYILDLVFASQPNTINKIRNYILFQVYISDHDTISFEVLTSLGRQKVQGGKVFQFHKADKDGILSKIHEFYEQIFEQNPYHQTIHENWHHH